MDLTVLGDGEIAATQPLDLWSRGFFFNSHEGFAHAFT
jgi:hypothetical protein